MSSVWEETPRGAWAQAVLAEVRNGLTVTVPVPKGVRTRDAWNLLRPPLHIWSAPPIRPQDYLVGRKWSGPEHCDCNYCRRFTKQG